MGEVYTGIKFRTVFKGREVLDLEPLADLGSWCRRLAEAGLAPSGAEGSAGNLSFRHGDGFVITATGVNLQHVEEGDFTEVLEADRRKLTVVVRGPKEPSSESLMHSFIYEHRQEIQAVFHGHDELILRYGARLGLGVTELAQPYGTPALVEEVGKVLARHTYLVLRGHGFVALGDTMEAAGHEALRWHEEAQRYLRSAGE
ncbi:MAG: class II aldolase/adducin family protein [Fidelibacterota bacterium]|nr:MAG: class II aldolase/adducin family protein [Candidatus Neomarinimicrobiota bacterium]